MINKQALILIISTDASVPPGKIINMKWAVFLFLFLLSLLLLLLLFNSLPYKTFPLREEAVSIPAIFFAASDGFSVTWYECCYSFKWDARLFKTYICILFMLSLFPCHKFLFLQGWLFLLCTIFLFWLGTICSFSVGILSMWQGELTCEPWAL